jgi:hypothetical protein
LWVRKEEIEPFLRFRCHFGTLFLNVTIFFFKFYFLVWANILYYLACEICSIYSNVKRNWKWTENDVGTP